MISGLASLKLEYKFLKNFKGNLLLKNKVFLGKSVKLNNSSLTSRYREMFNPFNSDNDLEIPTEQMT